MANAAIYIKGSDDITYFIKDCIQTGRNFKGSNGSAMGVKEHLFDVKWTEDIAEPGDLISELSEAKRYEGQVISTRQDVNNVIKKQIAEKYSIEDEIKIIRMKLMGDDTEWQEYKAFVESIVQKGKSFKDKEFKEIIDG
jgi:hypothetical protein